MGALVGRRPGGRADGRPRARGDPVRGRRRGRGVPGGHQRREHLVGYAVRVALRYRAGRCGQIGAFRAGADGRAAGLPGLRAAAGSGAGQAGRAQPGGPGRHAADRPLRPRRPVPAAWSPGTSPSSAATPCGRRPCCSRWAPAWPPVPCGPWPVARGPGCDRSATQQPGKEISRGAAGDAAGGGRGHPAGVLRHDRRDCALGTPAARRMACGHARGRGGGTAAPSPGGPALDRRVR